MLEHAGATDRGRARRANEDAWGACSGDGAHEGAFVVCDGMGGAAAGETASRMAVEQALSAMCAGEPSAAQVEAAVRQANATVFAAAQRDRRLEGMGTTLVGLRLRGAKAWVVHVGDSRCYLYREERLERLTRDHSLVEEQVRSGRMTQEQARRSPMQNVITRAIGTRADVVPEVQEVALTHGDLFLLASDGLTRELSDASIGGMLCETAGGGDLDAICQRLIAAANEAGGKDNITCVLVRC
ncbi:MAG: Stp1/IreP family PP2C-type Ser/Thr phosphatase [Acidobacteriaceae bacterium]